MAHNGMHSAASSNIGNCNQFLSCVGNINNQRPNISHSLPIKRIHDNYLSWRVQMTPVLRTHKLLGLVEGTMQAPPTHIDGLDGQRVINPEYDNWVQLDQLVLGWIISSLTESMVMEVIGLTTTTEVWQALSATYFTNSRSRALHLKQQLQSINKGSESITEYVKKAKVIFDSLAAISEQVGKENLILCILSGLGTEYESIVIMITNRIDFDLLTINDILGLLLNHEA
ncbi:PREDICTED: uncharacterized protein LOC104602429 [Nelumbo nucifera]|uniref:Uncharacterized protein LOC104602429 n=1 Tax=Nelumbo nucifera TaxID=4432 RepID=A0A1U8ANL5_NELNU|nr:PREDICTED: uncharacterized protein LOC104602429 [Nelumbo nucifera]